MLRFVRTIRESFYESIKEEGIFLTLIGIFLLCLMFSLILVIGIGLFALTIEVLKTIK